MQTVRERIAEVGRMAPAISRPDFPGRGWAAEGALGTDERPIRVEGAGPPPARVLWGIGGGRGFAECLSFLELIVWPGGVEPEEGASRLGDLGWYAIRDVPRWEVPEVVEAPQPAPVAVELQGGPWPDRGHVLVRYWREGDPRHCRLCSRCRIGESARGLPMCLTLVPVDVSSEDVAMYVDRG